MDCWLVRSVGVDEVNIDSENEGGIWHIVHRWVVKLFKILHRRGERVASEAELVWDEHVVNRERVNGVVKGALFLVRLAR